ncbi:hypothetical protein [Halarcobacter sp.]|uniref:hypothetical protein n=1 Tax=Halarcobacter sp. TaxID=2321133 RepID=UPI002AAB18FE|nr:hypothetical protein [Halarcobacter sp.]
MKKNLLFLLFIITLFSSCAQVPKQSVELSTTLGKDIANTHQAHIQLAKLFFKRMENDVNRFIDTTYTQYQIRAAMKRQKELADINSNKSLILAIQHAFKDNASSKLQTKVLKGMEIFVQKIHEDIEKMRKEMLNPLKKQEEELISSINRAYQTMHYANSIVTGHLSSIIKVHDLQQEVLEKIGIEKDLRVEIGEKLSKSSLKIAELINKTEYANEKIDKAKQTAESIKETIKKLDSLFNKNKE